jgi:hypothetical protein
VLVPPVDAPHKPVVAVPLVDAPPPPMPPAAPPVDAPPVAFEPPENARPPTAAEPPALLAPPEFRFVLPVPSEQATAAKIATEHPRLETNRIMMILPSADDPCLVECI